LQLYASYALVDARFPLTLLLVPAPNSPFGRRRRATSQISARQTGIPGPIPRKTGVKAGIDFFGPTDAFQGLGGRCAVLSGSQYFVGDESNQGTEAWLSYCGFFNLPRPRIRFNKTVPDLRAARDNIFR